VIGATIDARHREWEFPLGAGPLPDNLFGFGKHSRHSGWQLK